MELMFGFDKDAGEIYRIKKNIKLGKWLLYIGKFLGNEI